MKLGNMLKPLSVKCKSGKCAHAKCVCGHCSQYHISRRRQCCHVSNDLSVCECKIFQEAKHE